MITEGKSLASSYESKFIETSSGIQHNVDELLVGTLKQCRLRQQISFYDDDDDQAGTTTDGSNLHTGTNSSSAATPNKKNKKHKRGRHRRSAAALFNLHDLARELLGKLVFYSTIRNNNQANNSKSNSNCSRKSRSCENLYVL